MTHFELVPLLLCWSRFVDNSYACENRCFVRFLDDMASTFSSKFSSVRVQLTFMLHSFFTLALSAMSETEWCIWLQILHLSNLLLSECLLEQDGRLPPAYFAPSHFCEQGFWKDKCFLKKTLFVISKFSNVQKFLFFAKKLRNLGGKKYFWEIIIFDTHSTANLLPLPILKKFKF